MYRRRFIGTTCVFALTGAMGLATASDFPTRPIELVVPVTPGGGTDLVGRAFAEAAKKYLPQQPIIILNKPGASGSIGTTEVINAKPDGYKLGLVITEMTIIPNLGVTKHTAAELRPLALLNADPAAITVRADAPWKTIEEFIAAARNSNAPLSVGNAGIGSTWHMAAAAFAKETGIAVNHIPFLGAGPAAQALLGGHVDAISVSPGEVTSHVEAGKLRTLAVMGDRRISGIFENVPTLKERGINLSIGVWRGLALPKATPQDVVDTLGGVARKVTEDPIFRDVLKRANLGLAYADANGFQKQIDEDTIRFKNLVISLGLQK